MYGCWAYACITSESKIIKSEQVDKALQRLVAEEMCVTIGGPEWDAPEELKEIYEKRIADVKRVVTLTQYYFEQSRLKNNLRPTSTEHINQFRAACMEHRAWN